MDTVTLTGLDVLTRALELVKRRRFDCPYCACAEAKSRLDDETGEGLPIEEEVRQFLRQKVTLFDTDKPLTDATDALRPFVNEIGRCPSAVTQQRTIEMLESARLSVTR